MKIIITGATGSLGAFLTRWFSQQNHEIIAVGRMKDPPAVLHKYATYLQADITGSFRLPAADVCIHTAAIADDKAKATALYDTNVTGTKKVALAAQDCKMFVHVSSSSVYLHSNGLLTEEMAIEENADRLSPYGKSKLLAEKALISSFQNESCFVLRPRGIYGAGDKVLLPRLLQLVKNGKMIRAGSMNVRLSMTHFSNFALAIECCIHSGNKGLHVYNVSDDKPYILYTAAKKMLETVYNKSLDEKYVPIWLLRLLSVLHVGSVTPLFIDTISKSLVLDISKIKAELNYRPLVDFENGLSEMNAWVQTMGGVDVILKGHPGLAWNAP